MPSRIRQENSLFNDAEVEEERCLLATLVSVVQFHGGYDVEHEQHNAECAEAEQEDYAENVWQLCEDGQRDVYEEAQEREVQVCGVVLALPWTLGLLVHEEEDQRWNPGEEH